ncbi:MAG: hypothetical protein KatS3mg111_2457 [Pirellulaceae bacterium]|nr:MAG: hypothetical protein KatS3mg111_2457 [Pirellulaceae bacterium]
MRSIAVASVIASAIALSLAWYSLSVGGALGLFFLGVLCGWGASRLHARRRRTGVRRRAAQIVDRARESEAQGELSRGWPRVSCPRHKKRTSAPADARGGLTAIDILEGTVIASGETRGLAEEIHQACSTPQGDREVDDDSPAEEVDQLTEVQAPSAVLSPCGEERKQRGRSDRIPWQAVEQRLRAAERFTDSEVQLIRSILSSPESPTSRGSTSGPPPWRPPNTIGVYQLERQLGMGGEGMVFQAKPLAGGPSVALKILRHRQSDARLRRELRNLMQLAHPNIVVCYDYGEHQGIPYFVMELLQGPSLHERMQRDGPFPWMQATELVRQVAAALEHTHSRGILHRDVKPANIILHRDDHVKLIDLGLAQLAMEIAQAEPSSPTLAGTVEFMAPEQAWGKSGFSPATDMFGLGATWYYLMAGHPLMGTGDWRALLAALRSPCPILPAPIDGVPDEVLATIQAMCCRDADRRLPGMNALIDRLDSLLPGSTVRPIGILVVEDDEDDMYLTVEMLRRMNKAIDLHLAHSLAEAVSWAGSDHEFDLLITDLHLPDSFGTETISRLRMGGMDIPILAVSGVNDPEFAQACLQAGAARYLCKNDLTISQLERTIVTALSRL